MNAAKQAAVVRRGAGFFELEARGLLEVIAKSPGA